MGKVSWILIVIGVIVVVRGFIPIPFPKTIQYNKDVIIDVKGSLQPTELDFILQPGTRQNIIYSLKNGTRLYMGLLESNIDFYIRDSAGNILLNAGRVIGNRSLLFDAPKNDNYTLYFDNTFDKVDNKTISYRLYEAYYIGSKTITVKEYFEWNPWFLLLGQVIYFFGVHLTFQKTFSWLFAFCSGLFVNICSLFLFNPATGWFIVSLLTMLASSTYISYKLGNPELAFKILLSSVVSMSLGFLSLPSLIQIGPYSLFETGPYSIFGYIMVIAVFAFISLTVNTAGIVLSLFISKTAEK